ncbi:ATP-binding cassette domain-containing protein [Levilactobacillus zymae]|uniref:ABC transporter ATP-binding protein n=1 Tax=Levilactobacillus zymae TaxID=267363 RepID=UPI0028B408D9|nr:ATP-binding cassette domain-containing protein [Levilactobacillus zymae]MDT6981190.1 ATP-binding cassette domain-containing protein [Levilactobacillus zymae]
MATITIQNLTYAPTHQSPVLRDLTATFTGGRFSLLTGPSGSGKTTLLRLMAGLTPLPAGATITFDGQPLTARSPRQRSRTVALLFQEPSTQFTMDTVANELRFALENQQVAPNEMPRKMTAALDFVGIPDLRDRQLMQLSGGEQQKVALAIIVAMDSDVILLDEPFASIDPATRQTLLDRLVQLCRQRGKTIILADHDLSGYARWIDHLTVLNAGQLTTLSATATQARLAAFTPERLQLTHVQIPATNATADLQGHHFGLAPHDRVLVRPQSLALMAHKFTLITGPNGSGKSTFFRALVRLSPYQGRLTYQGRDILRLRRRAYARHVSLMFQSATAQFLNVTVAEELALSQKYGNTAYFTPERVRAALDQLHLAGRDDQIIYSLSSGQQKKLQLLCLLIMAPNVLLLDEPLKGLDLQSVHAALTLLTTTQQDLNLTLVMISHQLSGLNDYVDYHLALTHQQFVYQEATP